MPLMEVNHFERVRDMETVKISGRAFDDLGDAKDCAYNKTKEKRRPHYIINTVLPWGDTSYFVVDEHDWQRSGLPFIVSYHPEGAII